MGRRNTWRKMNLFFQKDIGLGTRFDFLPLEVLKTVNILVAEQKAGRN